MIRLSTLTPVRLVGGSDWLANLPVVSYGGEHHVANDILVRGELSRACSESGYRGLAAISCVGAQQFPYLFAYINDAHQVHLFVAEDFCRLGFEVRDSDFLLRFLHKNPDLARQIVEQGY